MPSPVLGIDLGTSGVRVAVLDSEGRLMHNTSIGYNSRPNNPESWLQAVRTLIRAIPDQIRNQLGAVAVDGTSGTLLACDSVGRPLGDALLYDGVGEPTYAFKMLLVLAQGLQLQHGLTHRSQRTRAAGRGPDLRTTTVNEAVCGWRM